MNTKIKLLGILSLLFVASACGNADMEKRIANLEQRVNQLENKGVVRTQPATPMVEAAPGVEEESEASNASFQWESTLHNFGSIKQGDVVNHTFKFTNSGTEPLQIQSTSTTCGCTVPEHTKEPIPPGGTGEVVVRFDSKGKSDQQNPVITVVANTNPKQTRLNLRGFVEATPDNN